MKPIALKLVELAKLFLWLANPAPPKQWDRNNVNKPA
jgi:hypothetical protein